MKISTRIKSYVRKFKRWLDKPNRTFVSPHEGEIIKIVRKVIYLESSDCFVDLSLNKRYIENIEKDLFIILSDNEITLINSKNKSVQRLCIHTFDLLCYIFDSRLSFNRKLKEERYLEDTTTFLDNLNLKLWKQTK
jgi:hypothetical protein